MEINKLERIKLQKKNSMNKIRNYRKANKLCVKCGSPLDRDGVICRKCADKQAERFRSKYSPYRSRRYSKDRFALFQKLSGKEVPECKYCGCDVYAALELNHINGGGSKDKRENRTLDIVHEIIKGTRDINDYNIACRVCNAKHYAEKKWGIKWTVTFIKRQ